MFSLLLALPLAQVPDAAEIRVLVERLRSEKVEDREGAARKLKALGKAAVPELEWGAAHSDPEVSQRAARLLRVIAVAERLTPTLRKAVPGIEERLTTTDLHVWTEEFLTISAETDKGKKDESLRPEDFHGLVGPAVRGARNLTEKELICARVGSLRLASAAPDLVPLLKEDNREFRRDVLRLFGFLKNRQVLTEILPLLRHQNHEVRGWAAETCGDLGAVEAIRPVLPLLEDPESGPRWWAIQALTRLAAREAIPGLIGLLKDEAHYVRVAAASALGQLEAREASAALTSTLGDPDRNVRLSAAEALCRVGSFDGVRLLVEAADPGSTMTLSMFNDLRAPETLQRLRRKECRWPFPDREEATFKEVLAAVTGLEIDLSRCTDPLMRFPCTREFVAFRKTAADMAASSIFVLEPDRIVYLSREDSVRFWKEWAESHAPPKK